MDKARAHHWFADLVNHQIGSWKVTEFVSNGKSAIVVKGVNGDSVGALKIFEPELAERFGIGVQLARIDREKTLIGADIPNLVRILDGGHDGVHFYVVMELLPPPWKPLSEALTDVPRDRIRPIIAQLAGAAHALEKLNIVHRDIKPENVMISGDFSQAKLLDLGVMKHFGEENITDEGSRPFIGTLRYSSPEFLMRRETDTCEGWRSLTFYQLGGVLHDLIMRKPLFAEFSEPFAQLVKAVNEHVPSVDSPDVHTDLLLLCRNCLVKDPATRLKCVQWDSFDEPTIAPESEAETARERVKARRLLSSASVAIISEDQKLRNIERTRDFLLDSLKSAVRETMDVDEFPLFVLTNIECGSRDIGRCSLRFGPSAMHSLPKMITMEFELRVIDPAEKVCKISVTSSGKSEADLFYGVFEHESVRLAVRDSLYLLMDEYQK
jgi:serine/threonine protein kinase